MNLVLKNLPLGLILSLILISCRPHTKNNAAEINHEIKQSEKTAFKQKIKSDSLIISNFSNVYECSTRIILPKNTTLKACILMLHGWNLPADEWSEKTTFDSLALANGYALIIPELKKCNYPLRLYPETEERYRIYPTLTWIMDTLIPQIAESTGLLSPHSKNFVAGISTGARGAQLLAYHMKDFFTACASLSCDFDITKMQDTYLYNAWFGKYTDFSQRWKEECMAFSCMNYHVPTYIGHGMLDNIAPVEQSKMMYDSLLKYNNKKIIIGNFPEKAKHDYDYWGSESEAIIGFFETIHSAK